ncbi:hypothetical protein SAMN05444411_103258 [Lutibacter oricola]|uniref:Uncharacterized protein n=1 Tax=Lutibacter oricola TaxID=762486 RepID=A0A1H2ZHI8_9FLAO|nr:hypothetical protein [Lutibacter oricola]SDX16943.1 hypothetical protein SAMN05444411_103258 [Lutibacter oricola]
MKRLFITILCIAFTNTLLFAQKADVSSKEVLIKFEIPSHLKGLKTFSYEIQDEGEYWNYENSPEHYPADEYPNLASLTDGIQISGLENVTENADLQILVGFIGNQLAVNNAMISMHGTYSILLLNKENQLLYNTNEAVTLNQVVNPKKFPMNTRGERNQTKARMLTIYTQKFLGEIQHLFKETSTQKLPFGLFKKTKGGAAEAFNTESKPLIESIIANPTDAATLDKAAAYWKSQIDVDFGKKVKSKIKSKVIYANLASVSLLKNEIENTNNYYKTVKENAGMFDLWKGDYLNVLKKRDDLEALKGQELIAVNLTPKSAYKITLDQGGTFTYKDKNIEFSKIEIDRFVPAKKSGMASLDLTVKPTIYVYENTENPIEHISAEETKIVTKDGKEIIFKKDKGAIKPYLKQTGKLLESYK